MRSLFETNRDLSTGEISQELRNCLEEKFQIKYGESSEERLLSVLKYAGKGISSAIKKDLSNRYSLDEDWLLPSIKKSLPSYDDGWIAIEPMSDGTSMILVYAYHSDKEHDHCDGVTFFPDKIRGGIPGALFHDIWYERMEAIAKSWGWKVSKVRKLGDQIFASIMIEEGSSMIMVNAAYVAVRAFGGIFHSIMKIKFLKKILMILIFSVVASGLSGCVKNIFDTSHMEYSSPVWTQEKD